MLISNKKNNNKSTRRYIYITVFIDILLLVAFIVCVLYYVNYNQTQSYNRNLNNITDITNANSQVAEVTLNTVTAEVERTYNYCEGKSLSEIMDYLTLICVEGEEYQLLEVDINNSTDVTKAYKGYSTVKSDGIYETVRYNRFVQLSISINDYIPKKSDNSVIDGSVVLTQLFNNSRTASQCFGVCCGIKINDGISDKQYFIIKIKNESFLMDYVETKSQYDGLEIAICYNDGQYLTKDESFRGDNFFDYIGSYNGDLSRDEKNKLQQEVIKNKTGIYKYANYANEECIFAYSLSGDNNQWLAITLVPTSEFVSNELLSIFPLLIISFLLILLVFNMVMLIMIVYKLRLSVEREQAANTSKTSFLSRMSHEIRTPLNAIIGYNSIASSSILSSKSDSDRMSSLTKVSDCMYKSELASKQLLFLINDVLDMSAIESGRISIVKEMFDFKNLIISLTMVFYSQAKNKKLKFDVIFKNITEEWFIGDQLRVNQILTNLLSNALKFTPEGGKIALVISQYNDEKNQTFIKFEVNDTGMGMSHEFMNRIWMPFEQADSSISRRFGGSGLGLAITKSLTDFMNGSIDVKSVLGKGSTFTVDIPFEIVKESHEKELNDYSHINVLIINDDPITCDYIVALYCNCGIRCTFVNTEEDAIVTIKSSIDKDKFTMLLVDWNILEKDSIQIIKKLNEISQIDYSSIVISAYDLSDICEEVLKMNVGYLAKPFFQSNIIKILTNMYGNKKDDFSVKNTNIELKGMRILLAEDNDMNKEIAVSILQSEGIEVNCSSNGKEVIDMFTSSEIGFYNAILMDIHMPEIDGLQATRLIRKLPRLDAQTIPIIAMTADAFVENIAETKAAGMNDHISKPINIPTLFLTLKKYMKRK